MTIIKIKFPDGSLHEFPRGTTGLDIARKIGQRLADAALACKLNGILKDINRPIEEDASFEVVTSKQPEGVEVLNHSGSHLLAQAALRLYPEARPTIGPAVEEGFYYDIDMQPVTPEMMQGIEEEMAKIVKEDLPVHREEIPKREALKLFASNPYKIELLNEMEEGSISIYRQGEFVDLCRGPHVPSTGRIKAFKLMKIAGAYWRAKAENRQLQRIYGITFFDKKDLDAHLKQIEEAEKRDHRKLGKELNLIMIHDYSPGSIFFYHKGAIIYNELLGFIRREYFKRGYQEVITPLLYDKELWETSGHWEHYKENMFLLNIDGREFSLKPMNCPSHLLIYKSRAKSYRDLPLRIADFAPLHRNELKGVLSGLTRVRKFSQDDSHTFVTEDQIESEVAQLLDFMKYIYQDVFKFDYTLFLSTKPEQSMGDPKLWEKAEKMLADTLREKGMPFKINAGDGAFYGPKIDVMINDVLGREWQLATIQLDFQMPLRFEATYEGADGQKHTPIMIHKALLGSLERFIGILIEHYAGKFPLWLSPVQVKVLTIADRHVEYSQAVIARLREHFVRVELDSRSETINKKVREAQLEQVNYILVIGDKEVEARTVNVRTRDNEVKGAQGVEDFLNGILEEIRLKK